MNTYTIEPITITTTKTITKFIIENITVNLFDSVKMNVVLFDENSNPVDFKLLTMENEEYKLWGDDDNYIINWITEKLK